MAVFKLKNHHQFQGQLDESKLVQFCLYQSQTFLLQTLVTRALPTCGRLQRKEEFMNKTVLSALAICALAAPAIVLAAMPSSGTPAKPAIIIAQGETANPAEFTLTDFTDVARGFGFKRPTSWTQDASFKDGVRFAGGDEWLTLQVMDSKQTPVQYTSGFVVPSNETKIGVKPFKQGKFSANVLSSSAKGQSSVTGKPTELLTDRWVFAPKAGKLAVLTVTGPKKVFDWEGNRDMVLSVRLK